MSGSQTRGSTLAVAIAAIAAFAMAGAASGCNLIVGSGDYVVDAAVGGGDDVSQAKPGDGSVGGDDGGTTVRESGMLADAPTMPGENDAGSDAAFVFEGGTPLEAGSTVSCGADGGLVQGGQASGADFQKLVDTCVKAVNCDPGIFPVNVSDCITTNYLQAIGSVACLSTITDCTGYYGCTGERAASPADCSGKGTTGFCTGNVATTCSGDKFIGAVENCDKVGGTCMVHLDDTGTTVASCAVVPNCTETDNVDHCSGNKEYECLSGVGYGEDCTGLNATCLDKGGGASCYFNAPSCPSAGSTCANGVLNSCSSDGTQEFAYQCSRAGLSCLDTASDVACVAPGCGPPSVSSCTESCGADGITAEVCIGGAPFSIDCTKHGFNQCDYDSFDGYAFCIY